MTFVNGCLVILVDLAENPSDPDFDKLWSTEFSWFFIDEAAEVSSKAKQVVTSRLRNLTWQTYYYSKSKTDAEKWIIENNKWELYHNEQLWEYQVVSWRLSKPKLLLTLNPWRNFVYTDFYKPWKNNTIAPHRTFIQSLPTDNPFLPKSYIENLKNLDKTSRERLLLGNFDYSEDPSLLFEIDVVSNAFRKPDNNSDEYYLTIDAARLWKDSTQIGIWEWLHLKNIQTINQATLTNQKDTITSLIEKYNIPLSNVIVDEVWVGWWLVDLLGCIWFIANASPMQPYSSKLLSYKRRNYWNLKTQAFFYLQKYFNDNKITINADWKLKDDIIEELLFIRQVDIDNDNKIKLESKKDLKERLWRSPDLADMISFRMYWLIKDHANNKIPEEDKDTTDKDDLLTFLMEDDENKDNSYEPDLWLDVY